ncbi:MAG TPA: TIGR01777 family oxidoreductase [Candidatus Kapabacteria bacterium]|nr:TIGR01777 family oxidoreductase [Candidatus Kapabacteria bacterium]
MTNGRRRIIVAGATGFLGTRLVGRLVERGDSVTAFVRSVERARRTLRRGVELVPWSDADADGPWRAHVDGADAIVNLAGTSLGERWNEDLKRRARDSRILSTRHLVAAIASSGKPPSVLVNASAVGYYGANPPGAVTEDSPPADDFMAQLARDWESEALRARDLGVRVVLVRTGVVLHPDGGALEKLLIPFKLFVGGPIGTGRQPLPWIHIDDEIGILLWALDDERVSGPVNAVAPGIVTNRELAHEIGRAMGRPSFFPAPALAIKLVLGEGAILVTGGQHAVPKRTTELGYRFEHPKVREALESLLKR